MIVVLLPKGGRDYRGIGVLELLWKMVERIMDQHLNALPLHEALHGCWNRHGTGMAILEAKLAQQLAHLEQEPVYGVFLDLKKVFNAMDRERCLQILEGYGVGPNMVCLIRNFLVGCNHGLSRIGELRGTVLCWPRRDPGGGHYLPSCSTSWLML